MLQRALFKRLPGKVLYVLCDYVPITTLGHILANSSCVVKHFTPELCSSKFLNGSIFGNF